MQREEHHDLLIQQLRAEIYELKKSQEDYYLLQEQLNRLETKYRILSKQKGQLKLIKVSNDKEHNSKHESYGKLILETKHELTVLEDELKYKQTDLKEIQSEGNGLKRLCQEKNSEIQKLRLERNALIVEDEQLRLEDQRLDHQMTKMYSESNSLKGQYQNVQNEIQHFVDKNRQYQKYLSDLNNEAKTFLGDIKNLEEIILNTQKQFDDKQIYLRKIQKQISDASTASKQLQIDIAQVNSQNEKHKGQTSHYIRLGQLQIQRANDIIKNIQVLQNSLKMIKEESKQVTDQINDLEKENIEVSDLNGRLEVDNENCEKHIQILGSQNENLMQELNKLAQEDDVVRGILMRKKGFENCKVKQTNIKLSRTSYQSRF